VILNILLLSSFAVATAEFVLVGLLPDISADLDVSVPAAGFLVTAYMLVVTVGGPAAMLLTRRWPRRAVLIASMAVSLAAALASTLAPTYGVLLVSRLGSALGQALFVAVASQVAMAVVPHDRQTAAVARVFNGFAVATVLGLPLGTLVGQAWGWRATFAMVAILCGLSLVGIVLACPPVRVADTGSVGTARGLLRRRLLLGLLVTTLTFTGFVAVFTYVAALLRDVTGLSAGWVSAALVLYGAGTVAGSLLAGRVPPSSITRVLPAPLAALAVVLLVDTVAVHTPLWSVAMLVLMGASAFVVAPLLQTWLMTEAGLAASGLAAAVNISVFGLAGALGAGLGAALLEAGVGLATLPPLAALPVVTAAAVAVALGRNERVRGRVAQLSSRPGR
jgi:MFS transporter, DHA1 family, inner membrane transport protein